MISWCWVNVVGLHYAVLQHMDTADLRLYSMHYTLCSSPRSLLRKAYDPWPVYNGLLLACRHFSQYSVSEATHSSAHNEGAFELTRWTLKFSSIFGPQLWATHMILLFYVYMLSSPSMERDAMSCRYPTSDRWFFLANIDGAREFFHGATSPPRFFGQSAYF